MSPLARGLSLGLFLTLLGTVPVSASEAPQPLVLSNVALPPLSTARRDGYLDRLYPAWFERAGLQVKLIAVPAARGLKSANAGMYDGEAARLLVDPDTYPNLRKVSEPVAQVIFGGMHLDPAVQVEAAEQLGRYRVGYVRGWQIAERLASHSDTAMPVRSAESLLNMLRNDRIDIALVSVAHARALLQQEELESVRLTDFRIPMDLFLYLHERHADQVPRLVDTLRAMKADGSYSAIMSGHDQQDHQVLSVSDADQ